MPVPVDFDAPVFPGEGAALVVQAEGGACSAGPADDPLVARLGLWLGATGYTVSRAADAPPCDGLPGAEALTAPVGGRLIGLASPARAAHGTGDLAVAQVGEDGRWWLVAGHGAATFTADHDGAPPTRFALTFVDAALPAPIPVPRGGAALLPDVADAAAVPATGVAAVRIEGGRAVAIGLAPGEVQAASRAGGGLPALAALQVGAPLGPSDADVIVGVGKARRLVLPEGAPDAAWVADPSIATARLRDRILVVRGAAPGHTHLVVRVGEDVFLVPLAVGT
jgi:Pilus formation protein N terminal region